MVYLQLFLTFLKIGAFTFGGGYAMLPLVQEQVIAHGWLSAEELVDFIAVSEATPGPFAVNTATYVGAEAGGVLGSVCATLGVVLPSFLIILAVSKCFEKFRKNQAVIGCMSGLKPAVVGLIAAALLSVGQTVFFASGISAAAFQQPEFFIALIIFIISAVLAFGRIHPIWVICGSAVLGVVSGVIFG